MGDLEGDTVSKKISITKGDSDHTHTNVTTEQTVKEFLLNDDRIELVMDLTTITQLTTVTISEKTDGTNYRIVDTTTYSTDFDGANVIVELNGKGLDQKVTLTSTVLEGASRNVPYNWVEENRV